MTKINVLLKTLCPNGVPCFKINDFIDYIQPTKYIVNSTNYDDSFDTPVLTAGQTFILGYTDEKDNIFEASRNNPVIIFDDFTASFQWVDFKFKVKSSAMKILVKKKDINLRYVYYFMKKINYSSSEHSRLWISKYSELLIPVPPIDVQNEIVEILDAFNEKNNALISSINLEIQKRQLQLEFLINQILSFDTSHPHYQLKSLTSFKNGKGHEKVINDEGKYIVVNSKFISTSGQVKKYTDCQICPVFKDDILMVMSDLPNGRALAKCFIVDEDDKYSLNQRIGCISNTTSELDTQFLYRVLNRNKQLLSHDNKIDQTNLKKDDILKISIPLPPKSLQIKAVDQIEKVDLTYKKFISLLEREIELRKSQFDYYRNSLLEF